MTSCKISQIIIIKVQVKILSEQNIMFIVQLGSVPLSTVEIYLSYIY